MSDDDIELDEDAIVEVDPEEPETPTETLWQRYLRRVPLDEVRRYEALEHARLCEVEPDKLIDLAAGIEAFLRDGRPLVEPKKLKAVKND
jgi:hypothetical protein